MKWIKCGERMPEEHKYESDNMQGHHEWTESERVLVWDSMYGPSVDWTRNGEWRSEKRGGHQGQICHGIIAWMPIPDLLYERKESDERRLFDEWSARSCEWMRQNLRNYIGVFTEHYVNDEEGEVVKVRPCINAEIYVDLPKALKGEI